jgi:hypothetical protein
MRGNPKALKQEIHYGFVLEGAWFPKERNRNET